MISVMNRVYILPNRINLISDKLANININNFDKYVNIYLIILMSAILIAIKLKIN